MTQARTERYLKAKYGHDCFVRVTPTLSDLYHHIFDTSWRLATKLLEVEVDKPDFVVVYSLLARPEHVFNENMNFVVYDQNLGQIFGRLTQLLLNPESPQLENYFHQLFAQRCYAGGRFGAALAFTNDYLADRYEGLRTIRETEDDRVYRGILSGGQEAFAIGHEIGHILFKSSRGKESAAEQLLGLMVQLVTDVNFNRDSAGEAWRSYKSIVERANDELLTHGVGQRRRIKRQDFKRGHRKFLDAAEKAFDEHLVEELVCDYIGFVCCLVHYYPSFYDHSGVAREPGVCAEADKIMSEIPKLLDEFPWLSDLDPLSHIKVAGRMFPERSEDARWYFSAFYASFLALLNLRLIQNFDVRSRIHPKDNEASTLTTFPKFSTQSLIRNSSLRAIARRNAPTDVPRADLKQLFDSTGDSHTNLFMTKLFAYPVEDFIQAGRSYEQHVYAALVEGREGFSQVVLDWDFDVKGELARLSKDN